MLEDFKKFAMRGNIMDPTPRKSEPPSAILSLSKLRREAAAKA